MIMSVKKIVAIALIYIFALIAWMILGVSNLSRTDQSFRSLKGQVAGLYGDEIIINSPECYSKTRKFSEEIIDGKKISREYFETDDFELIRSDIGIDIHLDPRKKGNLWFPTFKIRFNGNYRFRTPALNNDKNRKFYLLTTLGSSNAIYNDVQLSIDDRKISNVLPLIRKEEIEIPPPTDGQVDLTVSYGCTGMEKLVYYISPNPEDISQINDFKMTVRTDFKNYDFPDNMMSATEKHESDNGGELIWQLNQSVTGKDIGIIIPNKLNPGEIVSRVTFFAPVSLLFFFVVLFVLSVIMKVNIHPMNYFFLAATFFSFHLMYSYFSDHLNIYLTFVIASVASLVLTTTYLRLFTPKKIAWGYAPLTQLIYLIIFAYSFFFKGLTGVIVTICSVLTLFILMQVTAKVNWEAVFKKAADSKH
jgi:hypothetical protein